MLKIKVKLNTRDCDILRYLYDYRFLNSDLLWHLLKNDNQTNSAFFTLGKDGKRRPSKYGFGRQALYKRMKRLFDNGYVERHYLSDLPYGRGYGCPRAIYGLGRQSPVVLQEIENIPVKITRQMIADNNVKAPYLRHALELATFRVILELACSSSKGRIDILFWEQGKKIGNTVYGLNMAGKKEKYPVYPDAFFGLRIVNHRNRHFFLEIDRGTEPIVTHSKRSSIRRKLLGYQAYYTSKKFRCVQLDSIHGFQVLFVTPGQILDNNTISGRISGILNELISNNQFYTSKSLFLLTTPQSLSLERPETVLSHIWISPKLPTELLSLIE